MRIAIVVLIFVVSLLLFGEPADVFARSPLTHRDSIAAEARTRAFADYERNMMTIPKYRVTCGFHYAEEILYQHYGIKADMYVAPMMCGTGMEESNFRKRCYESVIDSLLFAKCGRDIYERVSIAGSKLEEEFPERYSDDEDLICLEPVFNPDTVHAILVKHVKYPTAAKRDGIEGTVYVMMNYDSTGSVYGASIWKSVRADLDSAAMAGAMHIGKVNPEFRWGICRPGQFVIPVKFALKD